ncbi:Very-long-chain enoyl-CoA reductase [Acorus calamus]|uniref:Very-long-chain enoyl-CoA reductase n=1 Tax=Acorus calamus TaxID=4465 RepID=A0AAV9EJ51_ACOCL|nr:Very-long-chain enoyl-CoA reductase [Acorus calamus]
MEMIQMVTGLQVCVGLQCISICNALLEMLTLGNIPLMRNRVARVDMPCRHIPCSGALKVPTVAGYIFLVVAAGIMTDWAIGKRHQLKQV